MELSPSFWEHIKNWSERAEINSENEFKDILCPSTPVDKDFFFNFFLACQDFLDRFGFHSSFASILRAWPKNYSGVIKNRIPVIKIRFI